MENCLLNKALEQYFQVKPPFFFLSNCFLLFSYSANRLDMKKFPSFESSSRISLFFLTLSSLGHQQESEIPAAFYKPVSFVPLLFDIQDRLTLRFGEPRCGREPLHEQRQQVRLVVYASLLPQKTSEALWEKQRLHRAVLCRDDRLQLRGIEDQR